MLDWRRWSLSLLLLANTAMAQSPLDLEQDAAKAPMPGIDEAGHGTPALVDIRIAAIEKELQQLVGSKHLWAGEYYWGDGLGANLSLKIADQTGFAITWHGCLGLYGANEGQVKRGTDGRLILDFRWQNRGNGFGHFARELLPVRWGERQYLIDANDIAGFVNDLHSGREPRRHSQGTHFLRRGDEERPAPGLPELPSEWLQQLRGEPVQFRVRQLRLEPAKKDVVGCSQRAALELDPIGHRPDVAAGIELHTQDDDRKRVTVDRIEAGIVVATWNNLHDSCDFGEEAPKVGAILTTGAFVPSSSEAIETLW